MLSQDEQEPQENAMRNDMKVTFIRFIQEGADGAYMKELQKMIDSDAPSKLIIKSEHFSQKQNDLADTVFAEFYKYESLLNSALNQLARERRKQTGHLPDPRDRDQKQDIFSVAFQSGIGGPNQQNLSIRELKSQKIGRLQSLFGTVTRTTQVRPQLVSGVFRCKNCNKMSKVIEQQFKYTCPPKCLAANCGCSQFELDEQRSVFADFQQLRVQQDPNTIPPGSMPRSINVVLRNQCVQKAQPGDMCKFVGYLCVAPEIASMLKPGERTTVSTRTMNQRGNMMEQEGVKGIKGIRELNYKFMFIANNVIVLNKQFHEADMIFEEEAQVANEDGKKQKQQYSDESLFSSIFAGMKEFEYRQIEQMKNNTRIYQDISDSLFPTIYGHPQIKKAILLQLFGGVHKQTTLNKINIRGDINLLIVGDPSTAKSQFLKGVNRFVPRSIYTNGKTTSAAGLTASVVRDDMGNVSIEAGALMLADNGVCCIDEFDKMNLSDMTAIHEAMEQQTISIAKAGVHATLNARTSILAAANPIFGRYDKGKNLQKNLNISPPIMSRFDLFFVICDESSFESDRSLCDFLIKTHREKDTAIVKRYSTKQIRFYMTVAKRLKPMLSLQGSNALREFYLRLREQSKGTIGMNYIPTVRQLESMIRLSQAYARLNLSLKISQAHVEQAFRLISTSITKLEKADVELDTDDAGVSDKQNVVLNLLENQVKKGEKKDRTLQITSVMYCEIIDQVKDLYRLAKQKLPDEENQIEFSQGNIINYVINKMIESDMLKTELQIINYKKIVRAVIRKMVKNQRILMIKDGSKGTQQQNILIVHPNHVLD